MKTPTRNYRITRAMLLGYLWEGILATYPVRCSLTDTDRERLLANATEAFNNGDLNSGDFESLRGASIDIEAIETVQVNGKDYTRNLHDPGAYIGDLSDDEMDLLEEANENL